MGVKYFVSYFIHNKENDGWAYKVEKKCDDIASAKQAYHAQLANFINSTVYDNVAVTLTDSYGNKIMSEYWQAPEEPAPTPNEEGQ